MTAADALASATRGTRFMVMLSAIYVLAHQITGATDLTIKAVTAGRNELQFHNTMGLFLNVVPFRTDIAACTSFRDIITATRDTFIDAMANELPAGLLEQTFPDYITSRDNTGTSQLLISEAPAPGGPLNLPIADGAKGVGAALLEEAESSDIPSGTVWYLAAQRNGSVGGGVHYNLDEFDETTARRWTTGLTHVLTSAVHHPDQNWRKL
jgi:non-ribosomal peptide synthetase component F